MPKELNPFDGPIPGANYTSDTKNYPWHRPPETVDLDEAIELCAKRLMNEEVSVKILTMVEMKLPIVRIADIFVTEGMYRGKFSVDLAIMLAGPICHIIKIMAEAYGIKDYNMGLDNKKTPRGKSFFKEAATIDEAKAQIAAQTAMSSVPQIQEQADAVQGDTPVQRGFMGVTNTQAMIADEGQNPNEQEIEGAQ